MAEYDLPAEMRHILGTTGAEKLAYIGHSQVRLPPLSPEGSHLT